MEEDPREGRKWMEKWTYLLTVPMALLSAVGQINIFSSMAGGASVLTHYGFSGENLLPPWRPSVVWLPVRCWHLAG
jgi:preprotein translocase subunit SecY